MPRDEKLANLPFSSVAPTLTTHGATAYGFKVPLPAPEFPAEKTTLISFGEHFRGDIDRIVLVVNRICRKTAINDARRCNLRLFRADNRNPKEQKSNSHRPRSSPKFSRPAQRRYIFRPKSRRLPATTPATKVPCPLTRSVFGRFSIGTGFKNPIGALCVSTSRTFCTTFPAKSWMQRIDTGI